MNYLVSSVLNTLHCIFKIEFMPYVLSTLISGKILEVLNSRPNSLGKYFLLYRLTLKN